MEEWKFTPHQVAVTDTILGRGAFGEVVVATWRGIKIACKRFYTQNEYGKLPAHSFTNGDFSKEINILSKLRHPNLLQFLGVVIDPNSKRPTMILTELMPTSLYDILENQKILLSTPDILDIGHDIASGLEYLHSHNPVIIHRDISSKNILIGGNRAKIADLGQARLYESNAMSKQTSMPGAMAYVAPEVLAGKYTEKVDIFSFGIVLCQMCCNEYPRIDKREQQIDHACDAQPALANMIKECTNYLIDERPSASTLAASLHGSINNDGLYPPNRRLYPQNDVGILPRRWVDDEVDKRCANVNLEIYQANQRLLAEEHRWQYEANRADKAIERVLELEKEINARDAELKEHLKFEEVCMRKAALADVTIEECGRKEKRAFQEIVDLKQTVDSLKKEKVTLTEKVDGVMAEMTEVMKKVEVQRQEAEEMAAKAEVVVQHEAEMVQTLELKEEETSELESRLEQSLVGWQRDKDFLRQADQRADKRTTECAEIHAKYVDATNTIEKLSVRLGEYTNLPMPEEIRLRFRDMEADLRKAAADISSLEEQKQLVTLDKLAAEERGEELIKDCENQQRTIEEKMKNIRDLNKSMAELQENYDENLEQLTEFRLQNVKLTAICKRQEAIISDLSTQLAKANEDLEQEAKRMEQMRWMTTTARKGPDMGDIARQAKQASLDAEEETDENKNEGDSNKDVSIKPEEEGDIDGEEKAAESEAEGGGKDGDGETDEIERKRLLDRAAKRRVHIVTESEGWQGLVKELKKCIEEEFVCWRIVRSLREYVVKDEDVRTECILEQVDVVLLSMLQTYPKSAIVQSQCIRLLGALAYGNDMIRRRMGEKGLIPKVCEAMEEHSEDDQLLLHACTLLTNMTHNSIENRSRLLEVSGVEILTSQMDRYRYSAKIQRQACWTLLTLSGSDDAARTVAMGGGISAVSNAMMEHRFDAGVQQFGCWVISNMALEGDDIRRKLRKAGVEEICKIAIETHGNDEDVLRQARNALGVLGPNSQASTFGSSLGSPLNSTSGLNRSFGQMRVVTPTSAPGTSGMNRPFSQSRVVTPTSAPGTPFSPKGLGMSPTMSSSAILPPTR